MNLAGPSPGAWLRLKFPVLLREVGGRLTGYLVPGKIGHGVAQSEGVNRRDPRTLLPPPPRSPAPPRTFAHAENENEAAAEEQDEPRAVRSAL